MSKHHWHGIVVLVTCSGLFSNIVTCSGTLWPVLVLRFLLGLPAIEVKRLKPFRKTLKFGLSLQFIGIHLWQNWNVPIQEHHKNAMTLHCIEKDELQPIPSGAPPYSLFSRHVASVRNIFESQWSEKYSVLSCRDSCSSHLWTEFVSPLQHSWLQRVVVGSANLKMCVFVFFNI